MFENRITNYTNKHFRSLVFTSNDIVGWTVCDHFYENDSNYKHWTHFIQLSFHILPNWAQYLCTRNAIYFYCRHRLQLKPILFAALFTRAATLKTHIINCTNVNFCFAHIHIYGNWKFIYFLRFTRGKFHKSMPAIVSLLMVLAVAAEPFNYILEFIFVFKFPAWNIYVRCSIIFYFFPLCC